MNTSGGDILEATLAGLETGLRVRHITTYELDTCEPEANVESVLSDPRLIDFDCIPVRSQGVIIGYVQRTPDLHGPVRDHMTTIEESVLVSADLALTQFVPLIPARPFRLVLDGVAIRGIVTWSDLQKLPIRLFAFSLITDLEMVMTDVIRLLYPGGNEWWSLLSPGRQSSIQKKLDERKKRHLEPPLLELTDMCDKRDILFRGLQLEPRFRQDLKAIEDLRNTTAHAGTYAESLDAVREFVRCLERAQYWIAVLPRIQSGDAARSGL